MPPSARPCTESQPCTVLLVEDDARTVMLFEMALEHEGGEGFLMLHAHSLDEMRERVSEASCLDAVILDLGLAKTDGRETLAGALKIAGPRVPVTVLTGGSSLSHGEAMAMGAAGYYIKTQLNQFALLEIVRGSIGMQRFRNELLDQIEQYERASATEGESAGIKAAKNLVTGLRGILKLLNSA